MVQKALIDFAVEHGLTQVHHQPTRDNNILDLVFTTNPSLVKTTSSIPGISDHAMIVTDIDIIPHYIRQKPRKVHLFSKANWEMIYQEMDSLSLSITNQPNSTNIEDLWELLKKGISTIVGRQSDYLQTTASCTAVSNMCGTIPYFKKDLHELEKWVTKWGMRFNANTCYVMSINQKSSNFYQLDSQILKQVEEIPYLGVTLPEDLKFSPHIRNITKNANSTLGFLKRNLKHCPKSCKKTAYLAHVRSTLEYSAVVWTPTY